MILIFKLRLTDCKRNAKTFSMKLPQDCWSSETVQTSHLSYVLQDILYILTGEFGQKGG